MPDRVVGAGVPTVEARPARAILRSDPDFGRTNRALFAAGFSTFALLYCVQPLMPAFGEAFSVSPAGASVALSASTLAVAFAMLVASSVSEAVGRKPVMVASLLAAALLNLACGAAASWHVLIALRAAEGIALSGLPAVAMAYVAEEMDRSAVGLAMGLYIGGSGLGGMGGRLLSGIFADLLGWRAALIGIGLTGLVSALIFWRSLPPSRHFVAQPLRLRPLSHAFAGHLGDAGLPWLFALGFVLLGSFVTVYNYIGYRLLAPPYSLSQTVVGFIFAVYLVGVASSAWVGELAGRLGRRRVLWAPLVVMLAGLALTRAGSLAAIVAGLAFYTAGFFGAHSIASSWVGARARRAKGQAASLYLFFYYMGSSVMGPAGGLVWARHGWDGVVVMLAGVLLGGLAIALRLARLAPLAIP